MQYLEIVPQFPHFLGYNLVHTSLNKSANLHLSQQKGQRQMIESFLQRSPKTARK